jgi:hypothetical protein
MKGWLIAASWAFIVLVTLGAIAQPLLLLFMEKRMKRK